MKNRLVLLGGDIVVSEGIMHDGVIVAENGIITAVDHVSSFTPQDSDRIIECGGYFVCPGFIDLHNQGGGGYTVTDGTRESVCGMACAHAAHGTTGLLLTPPIIGDTYRQLLPVLAETVGADTGGASILGIHAEGPFLNPAKAGCMPLAGIRNPDRYVLDEIIELGGGKIAEMTIAPELPGALDLILTLSRKGVVASLGHSNATLNDVLRAIDHGASHVTHFFNAMSPIHHREPGLTGAALYSTDLTVELVADGFHIHPWILGLAVQNKSVALTCLVTDCMHVMGFEDGVYDSLGLRVRLENGKLTLADNPDVLAGSVLTLDRAVANMVTMVGLSLADAVTMASTTPATVLGLENRKGHLETGYDADIAVLDRTYRAAATIVGGDVVHNTIECA
ncbi:N-acetylglucosamine-6-phosphate deacetylase [bacterium]|nr:N-acetylglucosamine-6-phosphate deacetylase [bacterium]